MPEKDVFHTVLQHIFMLNPFHLGENGLSCRYFCQCFVQSQTWFALKYPVEKKQSFLTLPVGATSPKAACFRHAEQQPTKQISWFREPRKYSYKLNLILLRFLGIQFWVFSWEKKASSAV